MVLARGTPVDRGRSAFAVPVATATVAVRTGIKNRAVWSVVVDAISPITTGPTT
jgi:hypothetical protein